MTIRRKGAAPWSVDYEAGLADAPVSSHPGVEADQVNPVIDAGFIDDKGNWQIDKISNDRNFTISNQDEAVAAGASMFIDPINMISHDILILALLDSSGNAINVDTVYVMTGGPPAGTPYDQPIFTDTGFSSTVWRVNEYPGSAQPAAGLFDNIMDDSGQALTTSWKFLK